MRLFSLQNGAVSVAVLALSLLSGVANAQLGTYDFTGDPGNQATEPPATVAANASLSALVRGSGLTPSGAGNSFSSSGWTTGATVDLNDFYGFTVAPDPGFGMALAGVEFSERRSGTGIRNIAIRTSLDGFVADIFTATVPDDTLVRRQIANFGAPFANLTTPVEVRIYGFAAEGAAGTWRLGISGGADNPNAHPANLIVNGEVFRIGGGNAAPEPGTAALALLGLVGVVALRRRK
jgi:MYXO-CTERM domain-containing protein